MRKLFIFMTVLCIILAGCSMPSLNDSSGSNASGENDSIPVETKGYYTYAIVTAGMLQQYCSSAYALSSLKSQAEAKAVEEWEEYVAKGYEDPDMVPDWSLAADKTFNWRVNPTYTGPSYYFVYVQASARPYIP